VWKPGKPPDIPLFNSSALEVFRFCESLRFFFNQPNFQENIDMFFLPVYKKESLRNKYLWEDLT